MSRRGARPAVATPTPDVAPPALSPRTQVFTVLVAFAVPLALYLASLHPGLPAGDSGELITVAATGGVAHPPGYPLYTMLAGLVLRVFVGGEVAWRLNLFSAVCMAAAAALLALAVVRLTRSSAAALAAAAAFAFASPVFKYALVAEVFPLNALLGACVLLALTLAPEHALVVLAFLGALALSHHHTLLLLAVPAFVATAIRVGRVSLARLWPRALAAGALGLLPLVWLPIAARGHGVRWGDAGTLKGFAALLLRAEYGTFRLDPTESGHGLHGAHLTDFVTSLPHTFGVVALLLLVAGVVALVRRARALALSLAGFIALQLLFYTRIGFPLEPAIYRGVVERFAILPLLVLSAVVGLGVAWLLARVPAGVARPVAALVLVGALAASAVPRFLHDARDGDHFTAELARAVLASTPQDAVLFVQGDLFHNALGYLQRVEHLRPDVTVLDQELMTYAWYLRRVRTEHPDVLPAFTDAQRITLTDGRVLEGLAIAHGDSLTDVLFERGHATIPTNTIRSVTAARSESLYAFTRARYLTSPLLERSDDRYSGLPASRNLRWLDHLAGRRPVAFLGLKEDSYALRYALEPRGLVSIAVPKGTPSDPAQALAAALAVFESADAEVYFDRYDPLGFELAERGRFAELVGRTALLMCQSGMAPVLAAHPEGAARVRAFAQRFEALEPTSDAYTLRAIGFLRAFDPGSRDLALAQRDLERALNRLPQEPPDAEAERLLAAIRSGQLH